VTWHGATPSLVCLLQAAPSAKLVTMCQEFVCAYHASVKLIAPAERCRLNRASRIYQDSSGQKLSSVHDKFINNRAVLETRCGSREVVRPHQGEGNSMTHAPLPFSPAAKRRLLTASSNLSGHGDAILASTGGQGPLGGGFLSREKGARPGLPFRC